MWIKIEQSLPNKPEVFKLAQELLITRQETIGHLVNLWLWTDQVCEDGKISGNREMVDSITMPQFANALINVGWLHVCEDTLEFTNFERHNGSTAKRRASNTRKVAEYRKRKQDTEKVKPKEVTEPLLYKNRLDKKRINYNSIVDMWNAYNTPKVERLTEKRKTAIKQLLKDFTEDDCKKVFEKIGKIPYMRGENEHGWVANFDYAIRPDKFVKLLEGAWDKNMNTENKQTNQFEEWNK